MLLAAHCAGAVRVQVDLPEHAREAGVEYDQLAFILPLNVNDLAKSVRPVVLPGEEIHVRIIQEGKEAGQGVGYLEDGTMIVVENGARSVGNELPVTVMRVLQTVGGRMIFAQPRGEDLAARRPRAVGH